MKKIIPISLGLIIIGTVTTYAFTSTFKFDSSSITSNEKTSKVLGVFNESYKLQNQLSSSETDENEIKEITKQTTLLLVGNPNTTDETDKEYYVRHKEYFQLGLYNTFPRDPKSKTGFDETNPNYRYAVASQLAIPQLFNKVNELGIQYKTLGNITISKKGDIVISSIVLPDVVVKQENKENPMKYDSIETNLILTYYFLKVDDEYKLAYLYGETSEDLENYFEDMNDLETAHGLSIIPSYDANLRTIYDYSKLDAISEEKIKEVSNKNEENIVTIGAQYNTNQIQSANGFFISDGLIATTWSFLESALVDAQFITVSGVNTIYDVEGIVTANPETDVAIIKLKEKTGNYVTLADSDVEAEDPVVVITSKTGVGVTAQKGIVTAKNEYIQTSIPLSEQDQGSILIDAKTGNVVGMNTNKSSKVSISYAISADILKEIQEKFKDTSFEEIEAITFKEIKEKYYHTKYNQEEVKNNIPEKKWKEYSKIGKVEENIKLNLVKASYKDKIVSLRYENPGASVISSMQYSSKFQKELANQGYKEVLQTDEKCIYENNDYEVIIMQEFDYLIIVMVRK